MPCHQHSFARCILASRQSYLNGYHRFSQSEHLVNIHADACCFQDTL